MLGTFDGFLLWANLSVSLLVIVAGAFLVLPFSDGGLALSLPVAIGAIVAAAVVGNLMLGPGGLIGADAGVPSMVLLRAPLGRRGSYLPTGAQHPPVPRLVGLRADRDRDRRERALEAGARLRRHLVLEDRVRRRRDGARAARAGRVRAPLRAQVRGLGRRRLTALSVLVVAARPARRAALAPAGVACVLARVRPRAREHHLVDAARRRLHALLADALGRVLGLGARLLRADDPAVRARRGDRDVALDRRRARAADGDRRRRARRACSRCSR